MLSTGTLSLKRNDTYLSLEYNYELLKNLNGIESKLVIPDKCFGVSNTSNLSNAA